MGLKVAFIGMNHTAQTACAEYLYHTHDFKRIDMDADLKHFLKMMYGTKAWKRIYIPPLKMRQFYDAIYKLDPNLFISHIKYKVEHTDKDLVISDIRYLNEMRVLQEMGFKVVRVTVDTNTKIGIFVKGAAAGTTALASLYDKEFAFKNDVEYSVHLLQKTKLSSILDPMLEKMGFNLTKQQ
jgi:hypothetical protein